MLDPKFFDNLAKQLSNFIPSHLQSLKSGLEGHFKTTLQTIFSKLDLVTREEFDVQTRLLEKARHRITSLEEKIKQYEELHPDLANKSNEDSSI